MAPPFEDEAADPEAEFEALANAFPDVGFVLDEDGRYVRVLSNDDSEDLLYDDPEELLGRRMDEVFDDEMAATFTDNIEAAIETGETQEFDYALAVGTGERIFEARIAPVPDTDDPAYVVYVARDVTARERQRRRLARQRSYTQQMLDSLDDLFYVLDTDGTLVDWNRTVEEVTGYGADELAACAVYEVFGENVSERLQRFVEEVAREGSARRVAEVDPKAGPTIPYEFVAAVFDDPDGDDLVVGIGRDVSDRREREQQVRVFGRVLRHNMRNKMTVIDSTAEYLREKGSGGRDETIERIQAAAGDLSRLAEKAYDVTELLLADQPRKPVPVGEYARTVVGDYREMATGIDVEFTGEERARALAIPAVERAIRELVDNAVEHGHRPERSPVNPQSQPAPPAAGSAPRGDASDTDDGSDGPSVTVSVRETPDSTTIAVADDGPGLPDHEANIITEEQEMSDVYHATGMGLWLVRWVVTRSGGDVALDQSGERTVFTISLQRPGPED